MEHLCAKLTELRIFLDVKTYEKKIHNISKIYTTIFKEKWENNFEIEERNIESIDNFPEFSVKTRNCFTSEKSIFSLAPDYNNIDEKNNYYPFFVLYTNKAKNFTEMFASVKPDPVLVNEEDVEMMETKFYENVKKMKSK